MGHSEKTRVWCVIENFQGAKTAIYSNSVLT